MNLIERANRYVETLPASISGSRGHDALLRVACVLTHGFGLSDAEATTILTAYNARCLPPWNARDLQHKIDESRRITHREPAGYLVGSSDLRGTQGSSKTIQSPRILGTIALPDLSPVTIPPIIDAEPNDDDIEAARIAGELREIYRAGHITGPDDPSAPLLAMALHRFNGHYIGSGVTE